MVPKCEKGDIDQVNKVLGSIDDITYMPLVETVNGYMSCKEILEASFKNLGVVLCAEDFSADVGIPRVEYHQNPIFFWKLFQLILFANYNTSLFSYPVLQNV